jgi:hypothetical protein
VEREWGSVPLHENPMTFWQNKIRHLRQYLMGWARDQSGKYKKEKERLSFIIHTLDRKAESYKLSSAELDSLRKANDELATLHREEESKWAQREKVKHIQEGGDNTKYFYLVANGKHRRKTIFQLEQEEGTIVGQENLKNYISEYYKSLFGDPTPSIVLKDESFTHDIPQLSQEENDILIKEFSEKEVFDAIMQMEKKALGPDGFRLNFIKKCGEL